MSQDQQDNQEGQSGSQSASQQAGSQGSGEQGDTREQHVETGRQSHKNDPDTGGSVDKEAGSHEDDDDDAESGSQSGKESGSPRGGTQEQHADAGRQSQQSQ